MTSSTTLRLSVPGAGRTIRSAVTPYAEALSSAFASFLDSACERQLLLEISYRYEHTYTSIVVSPDKRLSHSLEETKSLASAAVLTVWILARMAHPDSVDLSFAEAEQWFLGASGSSIPGVVGCGPTREWPPAGSVELLATLPFESDLQDLLPYILEAFQAYWLRYCMQTKGARSSALRVAKRNLGVFYTPSDVAEYIVDFALTPGHRPRGTAWRPVI